MQQIKERDSKQPKEEKRCNPPTENVILMLITNVGHENKIDNGTVMCHERWPNDGKCVFLSKVDGLYGKAKCSFLQARQRLKITGLPRRGQCVNIMKWAVAVQILSYIETRQRVFSNSWKFPPHYVYNITTGFWKTES